MKGRCFPRAVAIAIAIAIGVAVGVAVFIEGGHAVFARARRRGQGGERDKGGGRLRGHLAMSEEMASGRLLTESLILTSTVTRRLASSAGAASAKIGRAHV